MQLRRFVGIVDIGIAAVILVAILLPAREMFAGAVHPQGERAQFALALAEARARAHPDDGAAIDELARQLGSAGLKDWAAEAAVRGAAHAQASPSQWRALMAASVAYVDLLDVRPALAYANRALTACAEHAPACPSWEQVRMSLYQQHLDAGVKAGIDPRRGPEAARAFRRAGESSLRQIHQIGRAHV